MGAVLIDGTGGPPISNSVVLISGPKIADSGARTNIVIPQGAEEIDGSGRSIIPAPIAIDAKASERTGVLSGPVSAEDARRRIGEFAAAHRRIALIEGMSAGAEEAALEAGRKDSIPVFARVSKLADAQRLVAAGAAGFIGMIGDTERIDSGFIAQMRDLRVIWAPTLAELQGTAREVAGRNTRLLAAGGVPIAVAGQQIEREMELLVDAGLSPGDAILAATRNGARALRIDGDEGTLQKGKRADLVMLPANPLENIRNVRNGREMRGGAWVK